MIASEDGGRTWGEPRVLFPEKGTYLRNQPILSYDRSEWLLPLYHTPHVREKGLPCPFVVLPLQTCIGNS